MMNKALLKRRKTFSARGYTDQLETVKREIAIMKKLHHEHIVGLKEVMDDPNKDKIYLGTSSSQIFLFTTLGLSCGFCLLGVAV